MNSTEKSEVVVDPDADWELPLQQKQEPRNADGLAVVDERSAETDEMLQGRPPGPRRTKFGLSIEIEEDCDACQ